MNNPITVITEEDVADALQGAVEMMLAFEKQSLSPIERARVELAMGEHASIEVQAAMEEGMEHVGDALAVAVGVMLVAAGAFEPVG